MFSIVEGISGDSLLLAQHHRIAGMCVRLDSVHLSRAIPSRELHGNVTSGDHGVKGVQALTPQDDVAANFFIYHRPRRYRRI